MNGSFVRNWVSNNRRLVLVLFIMAILHIANRNHAESLIRDEMNLQKESVFNLLPLAIPMAVVIIWRSQFGRLVNDFANQQTS